MSTRLRSRPRNDHGQSAALASPGWTASWPRSNSSLRRSPCRSRAWRWCTRQYNSLTFSAWLLGKRALANVARLFRYGKLNHHGAFFKDVIALGVSLYLISYFGKRAILSENKQ
jgi:hypothetical protein